MPVSLTTGLPGGGKTLWTITHVRERSEKEGRPVYYLGIPDLALPWTELQPDQLDQLDQLPAGSIIVVDECQRYYPPRMSGARVTPKLSYFETHRHHGHDVYLITQHPRLIDVHVRKLVEQHRHVIRHWGKEHARIWEWQEVNESPDKRRSDDYGQRKKWDYPKDAYKLYRSTTMDTIQPRYPWHKWIYPVVLILAGVVGVSYFYQRHVSAPSEQESGPESVPASGTAFVGSGVGASPGGERSMMPTPVQIAAMHVPAIRGVPGTSPLYWELYSAARDYPRLQGCVISARQCYCYSQQATRVDVAPAYCAQLALGPLPFDHSREPGQQSDTERGEVRADYDHERREADRARAVEDYILVEDLRRLGIVR